jgi:hypothetical protein
MSLTLVNFRAAHGLALKGQVAQRVPDWLNAQWGPEKWHEIEKASQGRSFSGLDGGAVFACSGVIPYWYGRCQVWAIISREIGKARMLWLTRQAFTFLDRLQQDERYRRVEAVANASNPASVRWCEMLGFEKEGYMECYDPEGNDHIAYVRLKWPLQQVSQPEPNCWVESSGS